MGLVVQVDTPRQQVLQGDDQRHDLRQGGDLPDLLVLLHDHYLVVGAVHHQETGGLEAFGHGLDAGGLGELQGGGGFGGWVGSGGGVQAGVGHSRVDHTRHVGLQGGGILHRRRRVVVARREGSVILALLGKGRVERRGVER